MPTAYLTELKVKAILPYEKGKSIKALSEELHISQSTLYQWRAKIIAPLKRQIVPIRRRSLTLFAED